MLIGKPPGIPSSEITPQRVYLSRRKLLAGAAGMAAMFGAALARGGQVDGFKEKPVQHHGAGDAVQRRHRRITTITSSARARISRPSLPRR